METYSLEVSSESNASRLDVFLLKQLPNVGSRSFIQKLIHEEKVAVNGLAVTKPHMKVKANDKITVDVIAEPVLDITPEDIPLDIVYEDDDIVVINKPVGMVVHPAPGNYTGTLVNGLLHHFKELSTVNLPLRPGIVHRLDKDTSGLLVVAKNNIAHSGLAKQFQKHTIVRKYIAIVEGIVEFDEDIIELPLGRNPRQREKITVKFYNARFAKTHYRVLKRFNSSTLLELTPFTGRTHQLRVHLAHIGHSILGDKKYGTKISFPRMALHAKSIAFIHPTKKTKIEFDSKIPFA
ncbi:RluA family pseudouridine synthase [Candidatus Omnitrophota bacterium]